MRFIFNIITLLFFVGAVNAKPNNCVDDFIPGDMSHYIVINEDFVVGASANLTPGLGPEGEIGGYYVIGTVLFKEGTNAKKTTLNGNLYATGIITFEKFSAVTGWVYGEEDVHISNNGNIKVESCKQGGDPVPTIDFPIDELGETCNDIFQDAAQSWHKTNGALRMSGSSSITDSVTAFDFQSINLGGSTSNTCGSGVDCTVTGNYSSPLEFTVPGNSTTIDINLQPEAWGGDGVDATLGNPDSQTEKFKGLTYNNISVHSDSTLTFSPQDTNYVYNINQLSVEQGGTVIFGEGVYSINSLAGNKPTFKVEQGRVYIFFDNSLNISGQYNLDGGGELFIGSNGNIIINTSAQFKGDFYSNGDITIDHNSNIGGRVSGGNVNLNSASITNIYQCSGQPPSDNYAFTFDGTPSNTLTCEPHVVNIQVKLDDQIDTSYSKLVNLSTSTNLGDWSAMPSNKGALTNAGAGDATYKFEDNDNGEIEVGLSHTESGLVTVEVSNVDATATYDINFATAVIKAEFSCTNYIESNCINIANRPFDLTLTAIKENDDTKLCESYDPVAIDFWSDYLNPNLASGRAVAINTQDIGNSIADATPIELAFVDGVATVSSNYPDAGKIKVNVRETDQESIQGSAEVVLKPHQIVVDQLTDHVRNIQPGRKNSSDGFIRASVADYADLQVDTFDAQVIAIMDCTEEGTSSNCGSNNSENVTPSFANNIELENSLFKPETGTLGNLQYNNNDPALPLFEVLMQAGSFTYRDIAYDEVGSIKLKAKSEDYLNISANNIPLSPETEVGRFYPDYLAYGNFNATPAHGGSEGFTYMDQQQIKMSYVLQAVAQSNDLKITANYDESMGYPVASDFSAEIEDKQAVSLTNRLLSEDAYVVNHWVDGIYMIDSGEEYNVGLARSATILGQPAPDGPYFNGPAVNNGNLVNYYFRVVGQDGEQLQPLELNESCNAEFCLFGELGDIVYGRMLAENTHGSEYLALRAPVSATYFDGVGFPTFTRDSYSTFAFGQLATSPTKNIAAEVAISDSNSGITTVSIPSGVTTLSDGIGYIHFSAPTNAVRGKLKYFVEYESVAPWLLDAHNRINCEANPTSLDCPSNSTPHYIGGSVQFGLFRGNDRIIYRKQTFN
jgi:hypothetical protein